MDLTGQSVLVTGATGGLGSVVAREFLRAGARVAVHGRTQEKAEAAVKEILHTLEADDGRFNPFGSCRHSKGNASRRGEDARRGRHGSPAADTRTAKRGLHGAVDESEQSQIVAVASDIAEHPQQVVDVAQEHLGALTGVVNCAGIQPIVPFAQLGAADVREMLNTNVVAAHAITQQAAEQGASWVTHIASIEALRPAVGHAHYAQAKAALVMHARAATLELRGVRVNTVSPGLIDREGIQEQWPEGVQSWTANAPLGQLVQPTDVAGACLFLASDYAAAIAGQNIVVDGGMMTTTGW
jgi:NAD(P)-dependent dehydrogenase (short-subunit alcohol dehydrogenase family)